MFVFDDGFLLGGYVVLLVGLWVGLGGVTVCRCGGFVYLRYMVVITRCLVGFVWLGLMVFVLSVWVWVLG